MRGHRTTSAQESDIGLAISGATLEQAPELTLCYGMRRTENDIAAFMGMTRQGVNMIQKRALQKLKKVIFLRKDPVLCELVEQITGMDLRGTKKVV
jgi:DNA-directed RNA polymerase specialized sigma24 family protein